MECGKWIGKGTVSYPCVIDVDGGPHLGPCMARELPATIRERERWERERAIAEAEPAMVLQKTVETNVDPDEAREVLASMEDEAEGAWFRCDEHHQVFGGWAAQRHRDVFHGGEAIIFKSAPAPERHERVGDQMLPEQNDHPFIQDLVIADIEARRQLGIQRYGTALQPFNNRDAMQDMYDELLDAVMYLKQCIVERDEKAVTTQP